MQGADWIEVLRRIPANLHDQLALGLVTGAEIVMQQLIRMDNEFLIIRGRMSGSTAEGRVMLVPYSHLTLVAFNKYLNEGDVQDLFGGSAPAQIVAPAPVNGVLASLAPAATLAPQLPPAQATLPPPEPANGTRPKAPSKSILLARLRERLAEKAK